MVRLRAAWSIGWLRKRPVRRRLQQLAQSWDLLDQLPRTTVDEKFTRSTVEIVALAAEKELGQRATAEPRRRWLRWLLTAVAAVAACLIGFFVVGPSAARSERTSSSAICRSSKTKKCSKKPATSIFFASSTKTVCFPRRAAMPRETNLETARRDEVVFAAARERSPRYCSA